MATRVPTIRRRIPSSNGGRDVIVTWTGLFNADRGAFYSEPGMILRAYGLKGTLGLGGTVQIRCAAVDATDPAYVEVGAQVDETLITGGSLNALGFNVSGQYTAGPSYAPVVTAGDGTTNLTLTAYFTFD